MNSEHTTPVERSAPKGRLEQIDWNRTIYLIVMPNLVVGSIALWVFDPNHQINAKSRIC